jgi:hypothetical protein
MGREEEEDEKWGSSADYEEDAFYNRLERARTVVPTLVEPFREEALTTYSRVCGPTLQRSQVFLG